MRVFDDAAREVIRAIGDKRHALLFRGCRERCAKCGGPLDVYYCENGVYAVRCMTGGTVTLVRAASPVAAAEIVGADETPSPIAHAMWKGGFCTACGCETPRTKPIGDHAYRVPTMYCPDCGAKMDAKEDL